jgi:type 1 glutamine amidotransferase
VVRYGFPFMGWIAACLACGGEPNVQVPDPAPRDAAVSPPESAPPTADASGEEAASGKGADGDVSTDRAEPPVDASEPDRAAPDVAMPAPDAGPGATDASDGATSRSVLVFTRTTGFRHDSIEPAAMALRASLVPLGWVVDVGADPAAFTTANLARYAGVVLVSTTGMPLGDPGTNELAALAAFVRGGGALVGIHAATSTMYPLTTPYTQLLGGRFVDHPGGPRMSTCYVEGTHPSVAALPAMFAVNDEIYVFDAFEATNVIDLRCLALDGTTRLPIAWHRTEGAGRVFNTALGHFTEEWDVAGKIVKDHVVPGILWALRR